MTDLSPTAPHAQPAEAVAETLGADPARGLTATEVDVRRSRYGPNLLGGRPPARLLAILAHQFRSVIVWLLAAAAALSFFLGDLAEGIAIVVVLGLNGALGFFTELRAARSMEALARLAEVRTRVRRDGTVREIDARDLVPGDVLVLEAGDVVTADLRLLEASKLTCDESVLTGESVPVRKAPEPVRGDLPLAERRSMAFKGTAVTRGAGEGVVVATGLATELGRISALVLAAEPEATPLERRLDGLGHKLVGLTLVLAAGTILAGVLRGYGLPEMLQTGIALAVAAVPEGLPVVATLSLARGMWRMAARNALIRRLSAVETLGSATMILTDKTGTLTENRMTVVRYLLTGGEAEPGLGDTPLVTALTLGALCNNATLGRGGAGRSGDPMEVALLAAADETGLDIADLAARHPERREYAFDPDDKMMATVHADGAGFLYAVKGAPEAVIARCDSVLAATGVHPLDAVGRADWAKRAQAAARDGLRLLALAMKRSDTDGAPPYEGLTLVACACIADPLRADIAAAIEAARGAGVRVIMVTGDHAGTAARIARNAGLAEDGITVIEGHELKNFDPADPDPVMAERLRETPVFARVTPETKLNLVAFYQREGQIVAMTGDGVNDAPALEKADIGIAMGIRGTEVAREAADMVLKDDAFGTIVEAMRQGRAIFENIRKFVVYLMSCNLSEVLVVTLAVGAGLPAPLAPIQILFLNLVTDVFPAFALGFGRGAPALLRQPPRDPGEAIIDRGRWILIVFLGGAITAATLAAFALALFWLSLTPPQAVTVAFLTLALAQLWNVFNVRSRRGGLLKNEVTRNRYVWAALVLCLAILAAALWIAPLAVILRLPSPGPAGLILAAGLSFGPLILGQAALWWRKRWA